MAKKCNQCGAPMDDRAAFCTSCGAKWEQPLKFCNFCGKGIPVDAAFCVHCGKKLTVEQSAPAPVAVEQPEVEAPVEIPVAEPAAETVAIPVPVPVPVAEPVVAPVAAPMEEQSAPAKKQKKIAPVVGFWAYLGLFLLFSIPVVGFIASIVLSFAPKNKSVKNFARAALVWMIIGAVLVGATVGLFWYLGDLLVDSLMDMVGSSVEVPDLGGSGGNLGDNEDYSEEAGELFGQLMDQLIDATTPPNVEYVPVG